LEQYGISGEALGKEKVVGIKRSQFASTIKASSKDESTTNPYSTPTEHSIQTRWNLPTSSLQQDATDTNNAGQPGKQSRQPYKEVSSPKDWQNFPTQSPICSGDDGISTRLDSITFPKWRNESIKAAGNAIVPAVALQIFKAIQKYQDENIK